MKGKKFIRGINKERSIIRIEVRREERSRKKEKEGRDELRM